MFLTFTKEFKVQEMELSKPQLNHHHHRTPPPPHKLNVSNISADTGPILMNL